MSDVFAFSTFSCPDSTDRNHALAPSDRPATGSRSGLTLLTVLLVCLLLCLSQSVHAQTNDTFTRPQVLVLVMGGFGSSDQCSINYDSVVSLPKAQSDLDTIAAVGNWQVKDAKGETRSSGGPKPVPTTSISFAAKGLIGYADGTLPLEPYLLGLKRFKFIEVDFITPSGFTFQGLEDFENRFVKIQLSKSGTAYRYRIVVKNGDFTKLDLPLRQPQKRDVEERQSSGTGRVMLAVGLAVAAALVVYLVMLFVSKRR